jgi:hypothetical protein
MNKERIKRSNLLVHTILVLSSIEANRWNRPGEVVHFALRTNVV